MPIHMPKGLRRYWIKTLVVLPFSLFSLSASCGILDGLFDVDAYIELPDHQAKLKLDSMLRPMRVSDEVQALWFYETSADPNEPKVADICPDYASRVGGGWSLYFYAIAGNVARVHYSGKDGSDGKSAFTDCLNTIGVLKAKLRTHDYASDQSNIRGIDRGKQADPKAVFTSISSSHPSEVLHIELLSTLSDSSIGDDVIKKNIGDLISKGADVNSNINGTTPLLMVVNSLRPSVVEYLLKQKANLNVTEKLSKIADNAYVGGESPLELAVENSDIETYKVLRKYGADQNIRNRHKETLLHVAIKSHGYEIIPILINDKVDINAKSEEGLTALMLLLSEEEYSYDPDDAETEETLFNTLKQIVDAGADREQIPIDGKSAVTLAKEHPRLHKYLKDHGFK